MTTKLTTTITAAALAAFTAFAEINAPNAKSEETAALKARIEKLEKDLATLRAQFIGIEPIVTNTSGNVAFFCPEKNIFGRGRRASFLSMFFDFREREATNGSHDAFIEWDKECEERDRKLIAESAKRSAARTNGMNSVTASPDPHTTAE